MQNSVLGRKIWDILTKIQKTLSIILMIVLPLMVFIQVLLRYVFKAPLMGIEELMLFPTIWLYMIGGANASREGSHISCGILTLYIKKGKPMKIFNIMKDLISLFVGIWLTYWAFQYFLYSLKVWKYSNLVRVPMFFGESALFVGLTLMTFYNIVELRADIKKLADHNLNNEKEAR